MEVYGEDVMSSQSVAKPYVHFRTERVITEDVVCSVSTVPVSLHFA
jgi:hypothetical protein